MMIKWDNLCKEFLAQNKYSINLTVRMIVKMI